MKRIKFAGEELAKQKSLDESTKGIVITDENCTSQEIVDALNLELVKFKNGEHHNPIYYLGNWRNPSGKVYIPLYFHTTSSLQSLKIQSALHFDATTYYSNVRYAHVYKLRMNMDNTSETISNILRVETNDIAFGKDSGGSFLMSTGNTAPYTPTSAYNPATKKYVDDSIAAAVAAGFKIEVVDELPTENISYKSIYFVLHGTDEESNYYDEYVYTASNTWEKLGTTKTDLSGYYTKEEVDEEIEYAKTVVLNMNTPIKLGSDSIQFITLNDTDKELVRQWLNNFLKSDKNTEYIVFTFIPSGNATLKYPFTGVIFREQVESGSFHIYCNELVNGNGNPKKEHIQFNFTYTLNDNEITTFSYCSVIVSRSFFVFANNNSSYDVTQDYNPAHKKYVDEEILKNKALYKLDLNIKSTVNTSNTLGSADIEAIQSIMQEIYDNGSDNYALQVRVKNGVVYNMPSCYGALSEKRTSLSFVGLGHAGNSSIDSWSLTKATLSINMTWNENILTVTGATFKSHIQKVLTQDNTEIYVPTESYHPSTKQYVDDGLFNKIPYIKFNGTSNTHDYDMTDDEAKNRFSKLINDSCKNDTLLCFTSSDGLYRPTSNYSGSQIQNLTSFTYVRDAASNYAAASSYSVERSRFCIVFGTWENGVFTCTKASHYHNNGDSDDDYKFLAINNAKEYTPTEDYHPATKKYVDDLIPKVSSKEELSDLINRVKYKDGNGWYSDILFAYCNSDGEILSYFKFYDFDLSNCSNRGIGGIGYTKKIGNDIFIRSYGLNINTSIDENDVITVTSLSLISDNSTYLASTTTLDNTKKSILSNIAPTYSTTSTYEVGDYVTNGSYLYKCITAVTTGESFNSSKWEQTTVAEMIKG